MKHTHHFTCIITAILLSLTSTSTAFATSPTKICQRLPTHPAPQTTSTLRLLTAYAMPTIVARFWTWNSEVDHIYEQQMTGTATPQTLREFTRTARPYQWEINLFWNLGQLTRPTTTPLAEAYTHHEYRLREAHEICKSLRKYTYPLSHHTSNLEVILTELAEQRITSLLKIYAPEAITAPQTNPNHHEFAAGETR